MQRFPRGNAPSDDMVLASATWMDRTELEASLVKQGPSSLSQSPGSFWLGRSPYGGHPVCNGDDRHVVLIAGSRAGKGRDVIIPNLLHYSGSVVCIDPKGENFRSTYEYRGLGSAEVPNSLKQEVCVLDPFNVCNAPVEYRAAFNPLTLVGANIEEAIEVADMVADAIVVQANEKDAHWDDTARAWIQAVTLLVSFDVCFHGFRDLVTVKALIDGVRTVEDYQAILTGEAQPHDGEPPLDRLLQYMIDFSADIQPDMTEDQLAILNVIGAAANMMLAMGAEERGSVLSTVARNMRFLQSPRIQESLSGRNVVNLDELKSNPKGMSLYLVLPQRYMSSHSRWLRLIISLVVARLEAIPDKPRTGSPVLAVLDEFSVLGHMKVIETSAGFMAGFGLKLQVVLQDLGQLKRHYRQSWETFLGNAGTIIAFGNTDMTTLDYVSNRLSNTEVMVPNVQSSVSTSLITSMPSAAEQHKLRAEQKTGERGDSMKSRSEQSTQLTSTTENRSKIPLMSPDEVSRYFSRDPEASLAIPPLLLAFLAGRKPLALARTSYDKDQEFHGRHSIRRR